MPQPKVNIAGSDGSLVGVNNNKLQVELGTSPSIDIGDVHIKGHESIGHANNTAVGNSSAEQLTASSVPCKHIDIMAAIANTGIIYIGGSGVTAATGIALYAGDIYSIDIENVNLVYAIASVNNEDVQWVYYN
tara:strand:- start:410 stop:808 length:399 start_codon:yes stop_codon:yes gene_type:complete